MSDALSSTPNERNVADTRNFARHYRQRLRAEVLLDAICDVTGMDEALAGIPSGARSMEIWTHRVDSLFLDAFGRPDGNQHPPYERVADATMVQALHLMNAPILHAKVTSDQGRVAKLAAGDKKPTEIIDELYLLTYSRFPTPQEQYALAGIFEKPENRRQASEDLLWALLNTPEFIFKD